MDIYKLYHAWSQRCSSKSSSEKTLQTDNQSHDLKRSFPVKWWGIHHDNHSTPDVVFQNTQPLALIKYQCYPSFHRIYWCTTSHSTTANRLSVGSLLLTVGMSTQRFHFNLLFLKLALYVQVVESSKVNPDQIQTELKSRWICGIHIFTWI